MPNAQSNLIFWITVEFASPGIPYRRLAMTRFLWNEYP